MLFWIQSHVFLSKICVDVEEKKQFVLISSDLIWGIFPQNSNMSWFLLCIHCAALLENLV